MNQAISSQFGHPTGLLGNIVGRLMATANRERIVWAVALLNFQSTDTVLEVGFGPGVGIELIVQTAPNVQVYGTVAIIEQPRWAKTEADVQQRPQQLETLLCQAGFQQIRCHLKPMQPVTCIAIFGVK